MSSLGSAEFGKYEYGDADSSTLTSLVIGFAGNRVEFEPAIKDLLATDQDVILYDYPKDVLLSGDGRILPALADSISADFQTSSNGHQYERHSGVSLGVGIAWKMQRLNQEARPGIYAAAGTDPAKLIMRGIRFRKLVKMFHHVDVKKQFCANGWDEDSLRETWADIEVPPNTGFALAVGGFRDYAVPHKEVARNVSNWHKEGVKVALIQKPLKGHTGIKKWFINNTQSMIQAAETVAHDKV